MECSEDDIDALYDSADTLMRAGDIEGLEKMASGIPGDITLMLSYLTATIGMKSKLIECRSRIAESIRQQSGAEADALLSGLL